MMPRRHIAGARHAELRRRATRLLYAADTAPCHDTPFLTPVCRRRLWPRYAV